MTKKTQTILSISGLLICLQLLLFGIKQIVFLFVTRTQFTDSLATMLAMIVVGAIFILYTIKRNVELSVWPTDFSKAYIVATCVMIALFIATPANYIEGFPAILLLFYGSVITPIFEELIFRGYIWNKLNRAYKNEWLNYTISTVLFGLWHLGAIYSIAFRIESGLAKIMMLKVMVGLFYGVVLGLLRLKTKNCYATMILHGIMNIFGR